MIFPKKQVGKSSINKISQEDPSIGNGQFLPNFMEVYISGTAQRSFLKLCCMATTYDKTKLP